MGRSKDQRRPGRARAALILLAIVCAGVAHATPRSRALRAEFQRIEPCPATGERRGACPGFEVDHAIALCLTGPGGDTISNLQWLSRDDHMRKTVRDVDLCRQARRL